MTEEIDVKIMPGSGGMLEEGMTALEFYRYRERKRPSRYLAKFIAALKFLPVSCSVLEVGCGPGFTLQHLSNKVCASEFVGCDADPEVLLMARRRCEKINWVQNEHDRLPFLDESFSLVFTEYAMHHFRDPNKMLLEMWRVLKPGGRLILIDLNPHALVSRLFLAYVGMKKSIRVSSKIDKVIANSIDNSLPVERIMLMFKAAGILAVERGSLISVCYEAEKIACSK